MSSKTMEELFRKVGFENYKDMKPYEFYDVSDKKVYIMSHNDVTNVNEKKLVEKVVFKGEAEIYDVVLKDGTVMLSGSEGHNVFDADIGKYVALGDVESFTALNNAGDKIKCFVKKTGRKEPILDIQVKDNSNYFSNGILSHNTGGTAVKFFASTRNRITKIDQLKDNSGNDAGIQIRVRNYKNKTGIPWRDAVMNLYFDRGFDSDAEYFDFLSEFGLITKGNGGVYSADFWNESTGVPTGKIRGAANALAWFQDPAHRDIYESLKVKVNEKLMSKNELDADSVNPEIGEIEEVAKEKNISTSKLAEEALNASKAEEALEKEVVSSTEETPPDLGL